MQINLIRAEDIEGFASHLSDELTQCCGLDEEQFDIIYELIHYEISEFLDYPEWRNYN